MISRYTLPQMGHIWSEENKLNNWLRIEIAVCEAAAELGRIPKHALDNIKARAGFEITRIKEIEAQVHHDVIAFLTNVAEYVGDDSKYIHLGMTSSDVLDTGLSMQMRDAADIILDKLERLSALIKDKAVQYRDTLCMGRTHGVHGEPTTFGLKMALWYTELQRNISRLQQARTMVACGIVSGAVGNFAHIDPRIEEMVCCQLDLTPCPVSTQIIQRDRHAHFMTTLAIIASSLEKMAVEIRNLQRTELLEVEEPFHQGQKGSSAMPHKRNPMISERVSGLSRIVRGNALAALEDVALWHERDLTHSSVERVIIPDSCILLDYMLHKFSEVIEGLTVHEDNMAQNIEHTRGVIFSQELMLALVGKGMLREDAYALVQKHAMDSWQQGLSFKMLAESDPQISVMLNAAEINEVFTLEIYQRNIDFIFQRCGIER